MATSNEKTELTIRSISVAWIVKALVVKYAPEFSDSVDWVTYFKSEGEARRQLSSQIKNKLKEHLEHLGLDPWKCVIFRRLVCFLLFIC